MTIEEKIKLLEKALAPTHDILDVMDEVERGEAQLWDTDNAVVVTQVHEYPQMTVLHFWLAAGELEGVLSMEDKIMDWGREQGCTHATLSGRKGWERVLKERGWSPQVRIMGREL